MAIRGVFNFRDLASVSPDVRPGMVFRSDGLHRTDDAGAEALFELGIRRVMDLRSLAEQEREGMFRHAAIETIGASLVTSNVEIGRQIMQGGEDPLLDHYLHMLDDSATEIAAAIGIITDSIDQGLPVVFHCTAGKDRTGLLAAIVLGLVGVDDETIVSDFATSAAGVERMRDFYLSDRGETHEEKAAQMGIDPQVAHHMMRADPETMIGLLAGLRERHGDFAGYSTVLGLGPERLASLATLRRAD